MRSKKRRRRIGQLLNRTLHQIDMIMLWIFRLFIINPTSPNHTPQIFLYIFRVHIILIHFNPILYSRNKFNHIYLNVLYITSFQDTHKNNAHLKSSLKNNMLNEFLLIDHVIYIIIM